MKKILIFGGWGQKSDPIVNLIEGSTFFDYLKFSTIEHAFSSLKYDNYSLIVGWSLGSLIAIRAILENKITSKATLLITPPYKFITNKNKNDFNNLKNALAQDPEKTLQRFASLIAQGDKKTKEIYKICKDSIYPNNINLLYWLNYLENSNCNDFDLTKLPPTFLFWGDNDKIVDHNQSSFFPDSNCMSMILKDCGHAPHLNDPELFSKTCTYAISNL